MSAWYANGLRFECTRCGNCCTGPQGFVWLSPKDIAGIADYLGLERAAFQKRYTRLVGQMFSLVDKPNGDCIFLKEDRSCSIQSVKPRQCVTFPFWPRLVETRAEWREVAEACPGIGSGPLYRREEIDVIVDRESPRKVVCRILEDKRV